MPDPTPHDQVEQLVAEARRAFAKDVDQVLLEIRVYSASGGTSLSQGDAWAVLRRVLLEKFEERLPLRSHADPMLLQLVRDASRLLNTDLGSLSWGGDRRDWNDAAAPFVADGPDPSDPRRI